MEIVNDTRPLVLPLEPQLFAPGEVCWVSATAHCHYMLDRLIIPDPDARLNDVPGGMLERKKVALLGNLHSLGNGEDFTILAIQAGSVYVPDMPRPAMDFSEWSRWRHRVASNHPIFEGEQLRVLVRNDFAEELVFRAMSFGRRIKKRNPG